MDVEALLNQQNVLGCISFSFVSNPIDLSESQNIIVKVKGLGVSEMDYLLRIICLLLSNLVSGLAPNKEPQLARRKGRRRS